jgi:hypothetical protein
MLRVARGSENMEFAIVIVGFGVWLVIDGLYSIFEYRKQTLQEHLIRVIRAAIGITLVTLYFL